MSALVVNPLKGADPGEIDVEGKVGFIANVFFARLRAFFSYTPRPPEKKKRRGVSLRACDSFAHFGAALGTFCERWSAEKGFVAKTIIKVSLAGHARQNIFCARNHALWLLLSNRDRATLRIT